MAGKQYKRGGRHEHEKKEHEKYARGGRHHGDGHGVGHGDHGGEGPPQTQGRGLHGVEYSGGKDKVIKVAKEETNRFKHGGKVMGHKSKSRMDKYARGGRAGGSPFSSAKIKENTDAGKRG